MQQNPNRIVSTIPESISPSTAEGFILAELQEKTQHTFFQKKRKNGGGTKGQWKYLMLDEVC